MLMLMLTMKWKMEVSWIQPIYSQVITLHPKKQVLIFLNKWKIELEKEKENVVINEMMEEYSLIVLLS